MRLQEQVLAMRRRAAGSIAWMLGWVCVLQVMLGGVSPALATGVYEMPARSPDAPQWVLDQGDVLSRINRSSITGALEKLAASTGNEVHLITIHRLDYGETVETFTNDLFETWFPTPESQANQTMVVLDTLTNTAAIRTGQAVQALLTESISSSVTEDTLMAPLRSGNRYNQAFMDASERLIAVLSGKPDPGPPEVQQVVQTDGTFASPEETEKSNATIWVIGLLLAATIIPMATYYFYQSQS